MTALQKFRYFKALWQYKRNPKVCSCGQIHRVIPTDAKYLKDTFMGGFYWNCPDCQTTLFKRVRKQ